MYINIATYGVHGVMGRPYLGAGEMRRMNTAVNIVKYHAERKGSKTWTTWAGDNPDKSTILITANRAAQAAGYLD